MNFLNWYRLFIVFMCILIGSSVFFAAAEITLIITLLAMIMFVTLSAKLSRQNIESSIVIDNTAEVQSDINRYINNISIPIIMLDDQLRVIHYNHNALSLFSNLENNESNLSLIRATLNHNVVEIAREAASSIRELTLNNGVTVEMTAGKMYIDSFAMYCTVLSFQEITLLRKAQQARSDLVANASHELRTPVAAAKAIAETLEEGVDDELMRQDFQSRLVDEITRLESIIEGLLRLARLEAGTETMNVELLSPKELFEIAIERFNPLLKPLQKISLDSMAISKIYGDKEQILEVITNLLDNALRVTPENGKITLTTIDGNNEVRFGISDQGPGIALVDHERIFERFYSGDLSRTNASNSGLGLAIARNILNLLDGRIWVENNSGQGTMMCFTLPTTEKK